MGSFFVGMCPVTSKPWLHESKGNSMLPYEPGPICTREGVCCHAGTEEAETTEGFIGPGGRTCLNFESCSIFGKELSHKVGFICKLMAALVFVFILLGRRGSYQ